MKNLFFLLFVFFSFNLEAQDAYYVTVVKGEVSGPNNKKVQIGDVVSINDKLRLTRKDDFLIVNNSKGRYIITLDNSRLGNSNELANLLIKDNIHIHAHNTRLSSRGTGDEISLPEYFKPTVVNGQEINEKTLITDELKIPIGNMGYQEIDNKEKFFFIQLIDTGKNGEKKNGEKKKLTVRNDSLLLYKKDFIFNGKLYSPADGIVKLGFAEGHSKDKKVKEIADVHPEFISKKEINLIIQTIKTSLPHLSKNDVINEIYTQLYFFYGKPDRQLIENLYDRKNVN